MILAAFVGSLYSWTGTFYFSENDPVNFGTTSITVFTLLKVLTLDDWVALLYINMLGCDWASNHTITQGVVDYPADQCVSPKRMPFLTITYFVSFIVLAAWMLNSLFTGSILTSISWSGVVRVRFV